MSLTSSLITYLGADTDLGPLLAIGTNPETYRIFHEQRPDNTTPALVFSRTGRTEGLTLNGPDGLATVRITIDAWADSSVAARNLGDKLKARLHGVTGDMAGTKIFIAYYESEIDLGDFEGDRRDKRISYDFVFILKSSEESTS
jgi:hypothetical protein